MIKVRKSAEPQELAQYGYSCEAVKNALIQDADEKCYICERYRDTDFEVEHLKSRKKNPDLENDWSNLYAACGYCNKKKSGYHDDMLNPVVHLFRYHHIKEANAGRNHIFQRLLCYIPDS